MIIEQRNKYIETGIEVKKTRAELLHIFFQKVLSLPQSETLPEIFEYKKAIEILSAPLKHLKYYAQTWLLPQDPPSLLLPYSATIKSSISYFEILHAKFIEGKMTKTIANEFCISTKSVEEKSNKGIESVKNLLQGYHDPGFIDGESIDDMRVISLDLLEKNNITGAFQKRIKSALKHSEEVRGQRTAITNLLITDIPLSPALREDLFNTSPQIEYVQDLSTNIFYNPRIRKPRQAEIQFVLEQFHAMQQQEVFPLW